MRRLKRFEDPRASGVRKDYVAKFDLSLDGWPGARYGVGRLDALAEHGLQPLERGAGSLRLSLHARECIGVSWRGSFMGFSTQGSADEVVAGCTVS
jgi:hypothetical protein